MFVVCAAMCRVAIALVGRYVASRDRMITRPFQAPSSTLIIPSRSVAAATVGVLFGPLKKGALRPPYRFIASPTRDNQYHRQDVSGQHNEYQSDVLGLRVSLACDRPEQFDMHINEDGNDTDVE